MPLFTHFRKRSIGFLAVFVFTFAFFAARPLPAQMDTNSDLPSPGVMALESTNSASADASLLTTNAAPAVPPAPAPAPVSVSPAASPGATPAAITSGVDADTTGAGTVLAALMTLTSLGGFLLYQGGAGRAKNCGHTSMLLLLGAIFGLTGFWIGGFAVQTGGIGDAHAALNQPLAPAERGSLDHELGFIAGGHHWGIMGSSGFFLATDEATQSRLAAVFLGQAALMLMAVAAALGAALERGRLLAMVVCAYLIGVLIYPLFANWVWGGGWLAELGREFGLGHGFVDLAGAGVVHETAGVLALVIAMILGPRHGRFGRNKISQAIAGHHMPFVVLGSVVLLLSWTATNAFAYVNTTSATGAGEAGSSAGLAAVNTLLAAASGVVVSFLMAAWRKRRPEPMLLCRGLLGGAVASAGCAGMVDPWAAFVMGGVAGLVVTMAAGFLEWRRIDDPAGAFAIHGACGGWGVLAVGLFANGTSGNDLNGVTGPVRGLFFGGAWHQLAAQGIGCATCFVAVFILGFISFGLVQKILGNRVDVADEVAGLDWPQTGAFGYQGDVDLEEPKPRSE